MASKIEFVVEDDGTINGRSDGPFDAIAEKFLADLQKSAGGTQQRARQKVTTKKQVQQSTVKAK